MRIFFTEEQIAASKAEWEPRLREFADATSAALENARRLEIYDHAVELASAWLNDVVSSRLHLRQNETLIVTGDEHLGAAFNEADVPDGTIFLYRRAWRHWWSVVFEGEATWWQEISWAINCPDRIIALAHPHNRNLRLTPNQTYLCTEEVANRGSHTVVHLVGNKLVPLRIVGEWVDSI